MSRVLVTGGAGFIGSHLVERLLKKGFEVVCLDNFNSYYDPLLKEKNVFPFLENPNFSLIKGDIRDTQLLTKECEDIEYIFHEAAQAGIRISLDNPQLSNDVNVTGTLNVLLAAVKTNVKKIINASSSSVYGRVKYLPFDEDHPTVPVSPYGVSKLTVEHYCRVFEELYGLKTVSLRYFTVYGPRMRPDLAINIFTRAAMQNKQIHIFGDGSKTRDFTFIDDICDANLIAMRKGSGVYNIGGGHQISIHELAEKIIKITHSSSEIIYSDAVKGDAEHTFAKTEKAKQHLGWSPKTPLDVGLKRYARWVSNFQ